MKYIDIHCHLNFPEYDADREEVIARAQQAGAGMIIVGTDKASSQQAVDLAEKHENVWAVIGLHPTSVSDEAPDGNLDYEFYKNLGSNPKVVGFGECGLDYFRDYDKVLQKKIFESHIALASELKKPLVLHIRSGKTEDAYKDALEIIKTKKAAAESAGLPFPAGDVHFFAGGLDYGLQFVSLGFYLSFTGVVTFAKEYHDVIKNVPLDRIMSETDAPFVTPVPHRGTRNEPLYVIETAHAIADIRGESKETVLPQLVQNARNLFKI